MSDPQPQPAPQPSQPSAGAAAPKPAPKPALKLPDPVYNHANGRLLMPQQRRWPTELWPRPWSLPSYRRAALVLAGIVLGLAALAAGVQELGPKAGALYAALAGFGVSKGLPPVAAELAWGLIKVLVVLHVIILSPLFLVWWERKISAHIQTRLGPMEVGGWHGWAQTIADGIKLLLKEDVTPTLADPWVHRLAPALVAAPAIVAFAPVTFGKGLAAADLDIGLLYVFSMAGVSVIGIIMAGWASGNKYSLLGGLRSAAQLVSYELPRAFSVVPVLMFSGSLRLGAIAEAQSGYWGGVLPRWFVFYPVVGQLAFLIFLTASVAETNRVPFDIPEAESELVAGFHTEYGGMKFSLFFLAEYAYVLLASLLTATLFLGAGGPPLPWLGFIPSWAWMLAKTLAMVFCFIWFRWTFPRFRVDRLMDFNWKFLLPWSFANIALAGFYLALL